MYKIVPVTSDLAGEAAGLYNRVYEAYGVACYVENVRPEDVERALEEQERYGGELVALLLSRRVVGLARVRVAEDIGMGRALIVVDSDLPYPIAVEAYRLLARRIFNSLEGRSRASELVGLALGIAWRHTHLLASRALGISPGEVDTAYILMEALALPEPPQDLPEGFRLEILTKPPEGKILEGIADAINDAFDEYLDYEPWDVEDADDHFKDLYRRRPGTIVAVTLSPGGDVAGVAVAHPMETLCGEPALYLSLLGVRKAYRGLGLGRRLVDAVRWHAYRRGARRVIVDSEPEVDGVYYRAGFNPVTWWAYTLVPRSVFSV
ncbi:MAG: GNAT family N-acetyltransferase [Desulfurococcales archaeon]|nr:GNAT family N-acetyltransferase [Desulfurococcales archaeon]